MQTIARSTFPTVKTEGALLPAELLGLARGLGSPLLTTYLEERDRSLAVELDGLQPSLVAFRHLASVMR